MSKRVKKKSAKKEGATSVETSAAEEKGSKEVGYLIRAIRVKPEMLEAAKAYNYVVAAVMWLPQNFSLQR